METLFVALGIVAAILVLGALASLFGADSRDGVAEDAAPDPSRLAAGGAR